LGTQKFYIPAARVEGTLDLLNPHTQVLWYMSRDKNWGMKANRNA
jgi:hypothetical protein